MLLIMTECWIFPRPKSIWAYRVIYDKWAYILHIPANMTMRNYMFVFICLNILSNIPDSIMVRGIDTSVFVRHFQPANWIKFIPRVNMWYRYTKQYLHKMLQYKFNTSLEPDILSITEILRFMVNVMQFTCTANLQACKQWCCFQGKKYNDRKGSSVIVSFWCNNWTYHACFLVD